LVFVWGLSFPWGEHFRAENGGHSHVTKTRGIVAAVLAGALVLGAGAAAFAFTDDGTVSAPFVAAANALKGAGCSVGFADGSFGYNSNVTRGQDAIFNSACDSNVAYNNLAGATTAVPAGPSTTNVGTITITAGGASVPGATQFQYVHGAAVTSGAAGANLRIANSSGTALFNCAPFNTAFPGVASAQECTAVFPVPAGSTQTYQLQLVNPAGSPAFTATANEVDALGVPFGSTRGNTL
jgi:hypothetical protein